ncbi:MAG: hypothetical protein R3D84_10720 [Paracoccaceae bacterium]
MARAIDRHAGNRQLRCPEGWDAALDFGPKALHLLPRSKVSIAADHVAVTAIGDSEQQKRKLESDLARMAPEGLGLSIAISAPRPVITPFTLRFVIDDRGPRFDACSADTERARSTITSTAIAAGVQGKATCTIGLGVPTPRWAEAVSAGIEAVAALGKGSITFRMPMYRSSPMPEPRRSFMTVLSAIWTPRFPMSFHWPPACPKNPPTPPIAALPFLRRALARTVSCNCAAG